MIITFVWVKLKHFISIKLFIIIRRIRLILCLNPPKPSSVVHLSSKVNQSRNRQATLIRQRMDGYAWKGKQVNKISFINDGEIVLCVN